MPHPHHGLHLRDFWDDVTSALNDLNPFQAQASTSYVTVYTTSTPAGYTGGGTLTTLPVEKTTSTSTTLATATGKPSTKSTSKSSTSSQSSSTTLPASYVPESQSIPSTLAVAKSSTSTAKVTEAAVQTGSSSSASASATSSADSSSDGTSGAAKAGIAIGVLAGILVVFLAVYFLFNKRRKQMERQRLEDDEKVNGPFADSNAIGAAPSTPAKAPRLSLRPVTQFLPNLTPHNERANNQGIAMVHGPSQRSPGASAWDRPSTSSSMNPANPFGNNAERILEERVRVPLSPIESVGVATSTNSPLQLSPISSMASLHEEDAHAPGPFGASTEAAADGGAVATAAMVGGLTRKASLRKETPKALDLTKPTPELEPVPPSPAGTEFSVNSVAPGQAPAPSTSAAAIAAAGGPAQSTVHRVQLDFKPTLDDEMELKAGQLVRLLHEYDDGWALCIRLDRSQQGVVPRTCLSTRPVKPRMPQGGPRGPPVNPQRGPNYPPGNRPQGGPGGPPYPRPESPARPRTAGGRPQSPAGRPMSPYGRPASAGGRPMSPAGGPRPQSPGPRYQQGRPQSPNGAARRMSPPGPSAMSQEYRPGPPTGPVGRKPVPGQAY